MLRAFFGAVISLVICAPMFAHHGASAYDRGATVTLKATITEFKYANPHVQIFFDAKDDKGNVQHWNCETINPAMLSKQGWSKNTLKPGDQVTIIGHPSRTGSPIILLEKLVLADGRELAGILLD